METQVQELTKEQAAELLGVSERTIMRYVLKGYIARKYIIVNGNAEVRIERADLELFRQNRSESRLLRAG